MSDQGGVEQYDGSVCCNNLYKYRQLVGTKGVAVKERLDTAIEGTASSVKTSEVFSETDSECLPAHPNLPDVIRISPTFDINTTQVGSSHQSIYEAWINLPEAGYLRDVDTTHESGMVYLAGCCGNLVKSGNEWTEAGSLKTRQQTNGPVLLSAGLHRIRVYLHDRSGTNSGFDLEFSKDLVARSNVTDVYIAKPKWECKMGSTSDCGSVFLDDQGVELVFGPTTKHCKPLCDECSGGGSKDIKQDTCKECSEFTIQKLYSIGGISGSLRNREWDLGLKTGSLITTAQGIAIRESFDFSKPTTVIGTWNGLNVNDTNTSSTIQDAQIIDGNIVVKQAILLRWTGTTSLYFAAEIGLCGGDLELKVEGSRVDGTSSPTPAIELPVGIHKIRLRNIDDYSQADRNVQYSTDGGVTWITDNTPPMIEMSSNELTEDCSLVKICLDGTGAFDVLTGKPVDISNYTSCPIQCEVCCSSSASSEEVVHPEDNLTIGANSLAASFPESPLDNDTYVVTSDGTENGNVLEKWKYEEDTEKWIQTFESCPGPMTRAEAIALRNAGSLKQECHYVITDPGVNGNLEVEKVLLHAVDEKTFSNCYIKTAHDNIAWAGRYDIDTNRVEFIADMIGNEVTENAAIIVFPWGVAAVEGNRVRGGATLRYTAGNCDNNEITGLANVVVNGGSLYNSEIGKDANLTLTAGTVDNVTVLAEGNLSMLGGLLADTTIGQDAQVTIRSGSNFENYFGDSTIYNQVGTGYIRYSTIKGTTTWTNGNTNVSNVTTHTAVVNTTGSVGTIYNSTLDRAYMQNLQNIPSLTVADSTISNYGTVQTNGSARIYIYRSTVTDGSRILCGAGARIDMSYTHLNSYSYIQCTAGIFTVNYTNLSSLGYTRNLTGNTHRVERCEITSQSSIRFDGTATNGRIYYSRASGGAAIYQTTGSSGCFFYYCTVDSVGQIYTQNAVNARFYYNNANSYSYIRSISSPATHYIYYCNATARGYIQFLNSGGRFYACNVAGQSILEKRGAAGNIYYSDFSAYYYAYIRRNSGTSSGLFGMGRRSHQKTNAIGITPYASGSSRQNF